MSWLKDIVRPKIMTRTRREVSEDVWEKCPGCGDMIYHKDLEENLNVCPNCSYHLRISIEERLNFLFDEQKWQNIAVKAPVVDPLKFRDRKRYSERLREASRKSKGKDAFMVAKGKIRGVSVVLCALDFTFMGGSMGTYVGEAIVKAAQEAVKHKLPLLIIPASGGARMQEGILSLMQMARTTAAIQEVKEAGLPYLVLLSDPTTGGVTASFAMLGDILMAEPGALIGFAGPRVIEQTIGETLPEGFQTAEYLLENGMLDMVLPRSEQPQKIASLLQILTRETAGKSICLNGKDK